MAKKKKRNRKKSPVLKIFAWLTVVFVAGIVTLSAIAGIALASMLRGLPDVTRDPKFNRSQTSKVFAADGTLLTDFHAEQHRIWIPLNEIPDQLQKAVIAIEDERYYTHAGVDLRRIVGALLIDIRTGKPAQGASTITQQYVRNSFITSEKTVDRKVKEAYLAYRLEKAFSKEKILEKYLNTIFFGLNMYGVKTASETYFGKDPKDLSLDEVALLAGIIRSPNNYSPYTHPDIAIQRRNLVLGKMAELGFITPQIAEEAKAKPLIVKQLAPPVTIAPYFVEYVKQELIDKYGVNTVFKGGLRIYTTIDLDMQNKAQESIQTTLNRPGDPAGSLVCIDPHNGYVKVLVGGTDFEKEKYNLAIQGHRQAGSAFKTFVLTTAIDQGISPAQAFDSSPGLLILPGPDWNVDNYDGAGHGMMTLQQATIRSVNAVFARLIVEVGADNVAKMARRMGIKSPVEPYPAIALGGLERGVSPMDMATAYGTLANKGRHVEPTPIIKVTDSKGQILYQHKVKEEIVVSEETAFMVTSILEDVIKYGTGTKASIGRPAAGKTGTTQSYRDAWFVGYTPDLVTAVWVGHPKGQIEMRNVHGIKVTGGSFPASIWGRFMKAATKNMTLAKFEEPKGKFSWVKVCTESGLIATEFCPPDLVKSVKIIKGTGPDKQCDIHTAVLVAVPNVLGKTSQEAVDILKAAGFMPAIATEPSNRPQDEVVSQNPPADAQAPTGSTITVIVSTGTAPPEDPNQQQQSEESVSGAVNINRVDQQTSRSGNDYGATPPVEKETSQPPGLTKRDKWKP